MLIALTVDIREHQTFTRRDARDPLGLWSARLGVTGDGTSGTIKVIAQVPAASAGGRIYTCYSVNVAGLSGSITTASAKCRLLTNFPDADLAAGTTGFSSLILVAADRPFFGVSSGFSAPFAGLGTQYIGPNDRFILLFGIPGSATGLVELEISDNVDLATYSFE